jgi:hypothetical protein
MSSSEDLTLLSDYHQRALVELHSIFDAGFVLAGPAALHYCTQNELAHPEWLISETSRGYSRQFRPNTQKKPGRAGEPIQRYRQDMIDFVRWDTVREVVDQQQELLRNVNAIQKDYGRTARDILKLQRLLAERAGKNLPTAFRCASTLLSETPAFGGDSAMKTSYYRVEKKFRDPIESCRYFLFESAFLESVGLIHPSKWPQSKEWASLYKLTK